MDLKAFPRFVLPVANTSANPTDIAICNYAVVPALSGEIICKHTGTKNCEAITGDKSLEAFFSAQQIEQSFDIVIIDGQLRSANPENLLHIIQQKSRKKSLSISLVSSGSLKEKNIALQQGFFATIVKPVQPIAFQTALTSLWEQWVELKQQKEK